MLREQESRNTYDLQLMNGNALALLYPIFHISEYDLLDGTFELRMQRQL